MRAIYPTSWILTMIYWIMILVGGPAPSWAFQVGKGLRYEFTATVLLKEVSPVPRSIGDVGFQTNGQIDLEPIWKDPQDPERMLISIKVKSPRLRIKSRRAPEPEGFIDHNSQFESISEDPVLVLWKHGRIEKLFATGSESTSDLNLKRGLASIFQYRTFDGTYEETDASGLCNITYHSMGPRSFEKFKTHCFNKYLYQKSEHPNPILGVNVLSTRLSIYDLNEALVPKEVIEDERHDMVLTLRPEAGTTISSHRIVRLIPDDYKVASVQGRTYKDAIQSIGGGFAETNIQLLPEPVGCGDTGCKRLEQVLDANINALSSSTMGSSKSATAFLKLIPLMQDASADQLHKILKNPKYLNVQYQLYDLFGATCTLSSHQAAMKALRHDETGEETERYLWALSLTPNPKADVFLDVLRRSEEPIAHEKLSGTYIVTVAALARNSGSSSIMEKARKSFERGLESCQNDECTLRFIRALGNLGMKKSVATLLTHAIGGSKVVKIAAWKALGKMNPEYITSDVKKAAKKAFYQLAGGKQDSSVRTLAASVILENDPSVDELFELISFLAMMDPAYEVRKYLSQRLQQLSDNCPEFAAKLKEAKSRVSYQVKNYNTLAIRGLSTAFNRDFLRSTGANGSLVTVQEINSGLLKRGFVDIVLESGSYKSTVFSLGLYASGLNSVVASSDHSENEIGSEEETSTSGMELSLLGMDIRPFVFFEGYTELMGHVWSGTASERTTAFQILSNLHRHRDSVALSCGFVADLEVDGALSFDLAGQVQLSVWSKTAQSKVDTVAGISVQGKTGVRSGYVQSLAEFSLMLEPKLDLLSDVSFGGKVELCMRLSQPQSVVRYHVYKVERIRGSKHRLRKTRRSRIVVPGKSYLLNKKNNEMCSRMTLSEE